MQISVVIPTYNRYTFLKRAIASVMAQTYQPSEIIVVDDGSTDTTADIQKDFPQIQYIYQKNSGVSSARNLGIEHASSEWIAFLDSDDVWLEEKLAKQILFHKKNSDILISYTDEIWNRDNQEIKIPKKFTKVGKDIFLENLSFCNIAPSSVLIHKKVLESIGLFDESLEVCEDYDLWLRILQKYEIGLVKEKLIVKYAGHDDQLSFKHWGMDRFRVQTLKKLLLSAKRNKKRLIEDELLQKLIVLKKGAVKYDKIASLKLYNKEIELLQRSTMNKINKCLFPAAGYGTRFLPATKAIPKEMLPVLTKPLLQYGVEEAIEAGMNTMAIVTGRGKRSIEDHFDISYELEHQIKGTSKESYLTEIRNVITKCTFSYTRQVEMKGLGHAILTGETLIGNEPFAVVLADDLCDNEGESVLTQMNALYEKYKCCIVAVEEIPKEDSNKYGVIAGDVIKDTSYVEGSLTRVNDMVEKPEPEDAPSNLAIIGRYILTPDIFDVLRKTKPGKGGEIQITDALLEQAKIGKVIAYKFDGKRFDCGSVDGFVEATNYFYKKSH